MALIKINNWWVIILKEDILIDQVLLSINNLKLKIIGDGNLLVFLKEKYKNDNIEFLGNITNPINGFNKIIKSRNYRLLLMYEGHPSILQKSHGSSFNFSKLRWY